MIITIDGPVASGKSTAGKMLAKKIGAYYLYTGLLYRAFAYILVRDYGYTLSSIATPRSAHIAAIIEEGKLLYQYTSQMEEKIFFNEEDITPFLKNAMIDQAASIVSTHHEVRNALNALQRVIAEKHTVVIDGRDSGSVVFPNADYKFYVTADAKERAIRWQLEQERRGKIISVQEALASLQLRDTRDSTRTYAPLTIPTGAYVIDTTHLDISETVDKMASIVSDMSV